MYASAAPGFTILLAGFGERIDLFLVTKLEQQGYRVRTANGYSAIIAELQLYAPHLALIDLPDSTALDQMHALRHLYHGALIIIGPPRDSRLLVQVLDSGADEYVPRPFRTDELLARVRAQLRRC